MTLYYVILLSCITNIFTYTPEYFLCVFVLFFFFFLSPCMNLLLVFCFAFVFCRRCCSSYFLGHGVCCVIRTRYAETRHQVSFAFLCCLFGWLFI